MPKAASAAVRVRVLPRRSVLIEGRAVQAGDEADVSARDAKTLIADGYVEPATNAKPKARAKREPEEEAAGRKPLTPKSIDHNLEERG